LASARDGSSKAARVNLMGWIMLFSLLVHDGTAAIAESDEGALTI
jgi:hypothetical protein